MDFLLLLPLLAVLVWAPILVPRIPLALGSVVFLVVASVFGVEFMTFDLGPMNLTLDRIVLLGLVGSYVVQRLLGRTARRPLGWDDVALGGLVGWIVLSTFTHDIHAARKDDAPIVQHLINGYLTPLAIYWITRQSRITSRQLTWVYAALVAYGVYLAGTGLLEAADQYTLVFPSHIGKPDVGLHFGRARGPMVHAVTYGMTLAACVVAGWGLFPRVNRYGQLALLLLAPVALVALFFSLTRSIWLGTAVALGVLMLLGLRGSWRYVVPGTLASVLLVVALANFDRIIAFDRTDNTAAQTEESVKLRGSFAYVSWKMFQDAPLTGCGFGQFPREKLPYLADRSVDLRLELIRPMSHHNTYLSILTELGLVGLALFLATLGLWLYGGWQLYRSPTASPEARTQGMLLLAVIGLYCVQCLFHEMSFSVRDHSLLYFTAALTAALRERFLPVRLALRNLTFANKPAWGR